MSDAGKAVFLSYASQDAEAAKRICEALRASGVEVWFDQSELRGGDAWDQKIRRQIRECALFVPIISPNTNARPEGYFRLEWKLAVDRSHLMADDAPFLFPIAIGDITDANARVPDKFRDVQWTKLRLDETPAELATRIQRLLSPVAGGARPERVEGADPGASRSNPPLRADREKSAQPPWLRYAWAGVGILFALIYAVRPLVTSRSAERAASPKPAPTAAAPAVSEARPPEPKVRAGDGTTDASAARDWPKDPELKRAMALIEGLESIPDDFALAEEVAKRALDRAPTNIEALTVMARVQSQYMRRGFDRSDDRSALARRYAERALQLAPDEPQAMLAVATYLFSRDIDAPRAERLLRRALELEPADPCHGRLLADLLSVKNRPEEALAQARENVRLHPRDVLSHYDYARVLKDYGRYEEFERALDATLAVAPLSNAIVWKSRLQFGLHNDLAAAKLWLDRVPERVRGTERAVFGYVLYAVFSGNAESGLEALRGFPLKWFADFEYAGPTALLAAELLKLQGKTELARQQYEVALLEIQKMRTTEPDRSGLATNEFWTLFGLGRLEEAKASYRRMLEGRRHPYAQSLVTGWWFTPVPAALLMGDRATALELLRESIATMPESRVAYRVRFQLDARMAPFRDDPEIQSILAEPAPKP